MSDDLLNMYAEKVSTRATGYGDEMLQRGPNGGLMIAGVEAFSIPLLELYPKIVEHVTLTGTTAVALRYKPLPRTTTTDPAPPADPVVHLATLANTPTAKYTEGSGNDYIIDYTNGTIARDAASTIGSGSSVKVTYHAYPQIVLTHRQNLVIGISRDIRMRTDSDIYRRVNQYAMTIKADVDLEETDAVAKATNIGVGV
jgi:hypothetical protein